MEKIASFCVNHDILTEGMYTSRIDGDITTYDIRMVVPNGGVYLENAAMHTLEHLFATYARNSGYSPAVIYVGPMGCRTGFYLLVRDLPAADAIALAQQSMAFAAAFTGEIPGTASSAECGNYLEHDLAGARSIAKKMVGVLQGWKREQLVYRS